MKTVEFLQYTLNPGTGREFHNIMKQQSIPLHIASGIDIVAFGNSEHDEDSYYLIRAYDNSGHLKKSQEEFYSSDGWKNGPRTAIIERIKVSVKSVMTLGANTVNGLRTDLNL
ncbi:NIPSNAP family protein [unidentified bacterial endosymbiont]|uniref:NIPSNAP family protein n=1 Tax=unidentified bacterial endosymbiont TaxID=2355 RepID=UPI00209EBCE9|nr:NIPSNAP family protein [unidentified bacterial endosymbiont]